MISRVGVALVMLLMAMPAHAYGVGMYVEYGRGQGEIDFESFIPDLDTETDRVGVGVLLDTNVSTSGLFSYRAQLGYEYSRRDFHRLMGHFDGHGLSIHQTIAIGTSPATGYRMWGGPSFRFGYQRVEDDSLFIRDIDAFNVGLGPQVGINWDIGTSLSASASLAYQYTFVNEDWDFPALSPQDDETFRGREHLVSFGVSVMLRFGDESDR